MFHSEAQEQEFEEPRPQLSFLARLKERFMGHESFDEEEEEEVETPAMNLNSGHAGVLTQATSRRMGQPALRLDQVRKTHITVRRAVRGFEDARRAADGLKAGQQQIINLEETPPEMAERIIDFLNGATYALDGSVEKIGGQVYLFTPSSVTIDIEDKPANSTRPSFLDQ